MKIFVIKQHEQIKSQPKELKYLFANFRILKEKTKELATWSIYDNYIDNKHSSYDFFKINNEYRVVLEINSYF